MKVRLTNKLRLPEPILEAISNDPYDSGDSDYTATSLIEPPRITELSKTAETVEDAADRIFSLQGQVMHLILERAGKSLAEQGFVVEKRFKTTYRVGSGIYRVSAQVDLFDPATATISDYKYTSVGSVKHGLKEEHRLQLNIQAELIRRQGFKVDRLEVVLLLRDWSQERDYPGYPESPVVKFNVPLMASEQVNDYITERIVLHEVAKKELPQCTDEERWARPTFAVMKEGAKRATRVFDSLLEAKKFEKENEGLTTVERPGKSIRCLRYCPARFVCEQAKPFREAEVTTPVLDGDGFVKVSK